jgi:nucleotide-binding universal stress UspA family protein
MSSHDVCALRPLRSDRKPTIQRLLFVADAAVADVGDLPSAVRVLLDAAARVYVLTPTLPGRLAWLADDVDAHRHIADERLDTVLGHMHSIDAHASGISRRGSVLTVIADAVDEFQPDHILLALRSAEHANWQERRLIEHIEARFDLPVTAYAVDQEGHTSSAEGPLLLCYDGSENAGYAIQRAGALFAGRNALVLTVWHPTAPPDSLGFETAGMVDDCLDFGRAAAEDGERVADDGVRVAREVGLNAEPVAVEATEPVWKVIVEIADRDDVATIVLGSRGLTGLKSMLLGSVSRAVVQHADRPALVVRQPVTHA